MAERSGRSRRAIVVGGLLSVGLVGALLASPVLAQAGQPTVIPPQKLSWYGDPAAPDISGVWVRSGTEGKSPSKEGWLPWPPPLKAPYAATWKKRVEDAAAGTRADDPVRGCLPAGMPRFVTGMMMKANWRTCRR